MYKICFVFAFKGLKSIENARLDNPAFSAHKNAKRILQSNFGFVRPRELKENCSIFPVKFTLFLYF